MESIQRTGMRGTEAAENKEQTRRLLKQKINNEVPKSCNLLKNVT